MPDASPSVHCQPFDYEHPVVRAAAAAVKNRSRGHCQSCGRKQPLEAHHWGRPYPPADQTTVADLTGLCRTCHVKQHLAWFFENAGGSPETLCVALSETVARLLLSGPAHMPTSPMRMGWAVRRKNGWAAFVTGETRPRIGEICGLHLRKRREWRHVVVTEVLGGRPGCWHVLKRFLGDRDEVRPPMCVNAGRAEKPVPATLRRDAA